MTTGRLPASDTKSGVEVEIRKNPSPEVLFRCSMSKWSQEPGLLSGVTYPRSENAGILGKVLNQEKFYPAQHPFSLRVHPFT